MSEPSPLAAALANGCPRCGARGLFKGVLELAAKCRGCGLDLAGFNVGDGAAAFLILVIGAVLTIAAIIVDLRLAPPWWVHLGWIPVGLAMTIIGLRFGKALLVALEYRHRAREGRLSQ